MPTTPASSWNGLACSWDCPRPIPFARALNSNGSSSPVSRENVSGDKSMIMTARARMLSVSCLSVLALAGAFAAAPEEAPVAPAVPPAAVSLTDTDVNSWLDGYLPYALKTGDIAGAVVVIVKDGEVLTERGYGYSDVAAKEPVDPKLTLFRPGSVS